MAPRLYFVTGANSGCGLEATRQLATQFLAETDTCENENYSGVNISKGKTTRTIIYLCCRSKENANVAIEDIWGNIGIQENDDKSVRLEFLHFDAYENDNDVIRENIKVALHRIPTEAGASPIVGGILLNAGGFGDGKNGPTVSKGNGFEGCRIAKLNLIGHAKFVKQLLELAQTDSSTRLVAVGSEAAFCTPGLISFGIDTDFVGHLAGTVPFKERYMGASYGWIKGILALYWAAFARHHPELYVVTVSPGAISNSRFLNQAAVSPAVKLIAKASQWSCFGGSHTVQDGAQRCVDAIMGDGIFEQQHHSGSFLASRSGFARDFGSVATLERGKFVADTDLQDRAWEAVNKFL